MFDDGASGILRADGDGGPGGQLVEDVDIDSSICVPVRDEARLLPQLLASLAGLRVGRARVRIFLYFDGCNDDGVAIARQAADNLPHPLHFVLGERQAEPNAGYARGAAMALALEQVGTGPALLFTTDADSRPQPDWITAGIAALREADVVAGRIRRDDAAGDPAQQRIEDYYDRLHRYRRRLDPVAWEAGDTHHFGGGANLAMTADAYRTLGGFRALAHGEDATLLDDAARLGLCVRRDAGMVVDTSSRREGRAVNGLADALQAIDRGAVQMVAHPASVAWQARAHALARRTFGAIDDAAPLAALIGLSTDHLRGVARDCPNGEAFAMRVVPAAPGHDRLVTLAVAEAALAALEAEACGIAA
ncbi:glycosyltransferase [Sphingomonas sp. NBWT7]|uniref:glycosyltransferase n=1 Tax=Sphingomonas sp. NBWT7 TaxID=2596913 RepID=UPI001624377F|nr:glycosyltransferase [Sphingomonas sp. NBWT7]QNE32138.1 glycosyltransferase [Sphingomonas sp. NBWT7]